MGTAPAGDAKGAGGVVEVAGEIERPARAPPCLVRERRGWPSLGDGVEGGDGGSRLASLLVDAPQGVEGVGRLAAVGIRGQEALEERACRDVVVGIPAPARGPREGHGSEGPSAAGDGQARRLGGGGVTQAALGAGAHPRRLLPDVEGDGLGDQGAGEREGSGRVALAEPELGLGETTIGGHEQQRVGGDEGIREPARAPPGHAGSASRADLGRELERTLRVAVVAREAGQIEGDLRTSRVLRAEPAAGPLEIRFQPLIAAGSASNVDHEEQRRDGPRGVREALRDGARQGHRVLRTAAAHGGAGA